MSKRRTSGGDSSDLQLKEVFAAARTKRYLSYSPRAGDLLLHLTSYAGVDSVSESKLEGLVTALADRGVEMQLVGGGYQCFRVTFRVTSGKSAPDRSVSVEIESRDGSSAADALAELAKILREPPIIAMIHDLTVSDAEVCHHGESGRVQSEKIDCRNYDTPPSLVRRRSSQRCALLLTATSDPEFGTLKEVLSRKGVPTSRQHVGSTLCHRFELEAAREAFPAVYAAACHHQGNDSAAVTVASLIGELRPQIVVLAGIAAGLNPDDVSLGDIVVAEQIYRYDSRRKEKDNEVLLAPYGLQVDQRLLSHARDLANEDAFRSTVSKIAAAIAPRPRELRIVIGDIASGDAVIDSAIFRDKVLLANNRKLYAVEMEGAGVLRACQTAADMPRALVVRGISDMAADKKSTDGDPRNFQRVAACAASAFAVEFLADYGGIAGASPAEEAA